MHKAAYAIKEMAGLDANFYGNGFKFPARSGFIHDNVLTMRPALKGNESCISGRLQGASGWVCRLRGLGDCSGAVVWMFAVSRTTETRRGGGFDKHSLGL